MLMRAVELRIDYLGRSLQIMKQYCFQSTTACPAKTKTGTKPENGVSICISIDAELTEVDISTRDVSSTTFIPLTLECSTTS